MDELARFFAFETRLFERLSTRIELFPYGMAFFDEVYRDRYSSNFLLADRSSASVSAQELIDAADSILGGAGYTHREVAVRDDILGEGLAPSFSAAGYEVEKDVIMVHRRRPDRGPDLAVEETPFDALEPLIHEIYRRASWAKTEEMVRAFTEQHRKYERVIGARFFAARIDGTLTGNCELYVDGVEAQIENVGTLEEWRGRGVARAVVLGALDAARAAGAENVFIVADEDDWPRDLYARLGFDRIGRVWVFLRWPEENAAPV